MTQDQLTAAFMAAPFIALAVFWLVGLAIVFRAEGK